ncbi:MAG: hypothetical protein AAF488_10895 [Planctomycetota bacterium]
MNPVRQVFTPHWCRVVGFGLLFGLVPPVLDAQDYSVLRINEVIADNRNSEPDEREPTDARGGTPDIVEIYNSGDEDLDLGFDNTDLAVGLSDTPGLPPTPPGLWTFRRGATVRAGESILVFCDGNTCEGDCEPHAAFQIDSDGLEPITLWGPENPDGTRDIIDQVWLPPLRPETSWSRIEDGAGPAPCPIEETFDYFVMTPNTTFGGCVSIPGSECAQSCPNSDANMPTRKRFCEGAPNAEERGNLEPRIERADHSTNSPAANEAVTIIAEVRDDKEPTPGNIAAAEIVYRVNGGDPQVVALQYDESVPLLPDVTGLQPGDPDFPRRPLDRRSIWIGEIPGQPTGARVQFILRVRDTDGLESTRPRDLCDFGVGPCSRDFGGHDGCTLDPLSTSCEGALTGVRYISCSAWSSYTSGYDPELEGRGGLVINEVMATQATVLRDPTSVPASMYCTGERAPDYCCFGSEGKEAPPDCGFEDFVEIYNGSGAEIQLGDLWLSDSYFQPRGWKFPDGAVLGNDEYAIVWLDGDGGRCPEPELPLEERPCFWDCPDPNDPGAGRYHASFQLNGDNDQIFIFDGSKSFGLVHGAIFRDQEVDVSLSLCPNGSPSGRFVATLVPTPRADNSASKECVSSEVFRRGDSTTDCGVDLTDAIFILNWLFAGGTPPACQDSADANDSNQVDLSDPIYILTWLFLGGPPPVLPGPTEAGPDPTEDILPPCEYPECP